MLNENPCQQPPQGVGSVQCALAVCLCVSLSLGRGGVEVSACLGQELSFILAFLCALLLRTPSVVGVSISKNLLVVTPLKAVILAEFSV